ncbi:MAG: LamG domain-containing protein, partial [Victivallales bacterium]|nr:LamG domain-containing protein [Victivallales bacterium]
HSTFLTSRTFELPTGEWHHLAFSYDAQGSARIFLDGEALASAYYPDHGPIANGTNRFTIGDRVGSTHNSFPGLISQVRFCSPLAEEFKGRPFFTTTAGRTVFYRFEKDNKATLKLVNDSPDNLTEIQIEYNGLVLPEAYIPLLKPRESFEVRAPLNLSLKPGNYSLPAKVRFMKDGKPFELDGNCDYTILPRENKFMPVVMWGTAITEPLKKIGFTHDLRGMGNYLASWESEEIVDLTKANSVQDTYDMLNQRMKEGIHVCLTTRPGPYLSKKFPDDLSLHRVTRNGKPQSTDNLDACNPKVLAYGYRFGKSIGDAFGRFPIFDAALIHSEVRDSTALSFHDFEVEAAEKAIGAKIPEQIIGKNGIPYSLIPSFPQNHVIPSDDLILKFYSWFWKDGDGWNLLHSAVNHGLKDGIKPTGRTDFWTFFDPAVRVPSLWGSGGDVDFLSQWTYSYPDAIKIGQATDELFAMAEGRPNQEVMKMTQIIWYRSGTAPIDKMPADESKRVQWERDIPDAQFITIAPDHLSIALWSMIARPVKGIMYHGWGSLMPNIARTSYKHTNDATKYRLAKLVHEVIQPLGPMLLNVPDHKTDVAILESFASQMYMQCGSNGWSNSWEADMHLILQWAGYQPRIIYDETIRKNGLGDYKVLVMPNCGVLTQDVYDEIKAFQARGGLIVSDEHLCPALTPDIIIPVFNREDQKAQENKAALQAISRKLREELTPFYHAPFKTSNEDLVARLRKYSTADYLFVINDKRTYGNYVGQYRKVMEEGLPNEGTVTLARKKGFVYDLTTSKKVSAKYADDSISFETALGPGDGKLYLVTASEIATVTANAPTKAARGKDFDVTIDVLGRNGRSIDAIIPMSVTIKDPSGNIAEFSGYHAAVDGRLTLTLNIASNDASGIWTIEVKELASGIACKTQVSAF